MEKSSLALTNFVPIQHLENPEHVVLESLNKQHKQPWSVLAKTVYSGMCLVILSIHSGHFLYYLAVMTIMTCALVLAAKKSDPRLYDTPVDVLRGVCEGICILAIGYNGIAELNQLRMWVQLYVYTTIVYFLFIFSHKRLYLKDYFNFLDVPATLLFFMIIPFRATGLNVQWLFASLCYLFNGLRAIEFAAVFR